MFGFIDERTKRSENQVFEVFVEYYLHFLPCNDFLKITLQIYKQNILITITKLAKHYTII